MTATATLAGIAILVSLFSFGINWRAARRAEERTRAPVLVTRRNANGIVVENVGRGPALNVILAQLDESAEGGEGVSPLLAPAENWISPIHLVPIAAGDTAECFVGATRDFIGVCYTDFLGKEYTTTSGPTGMKIREGPKVRHWEFTRKFPPFPEDVLEEGRSAGKDRW